LCSFRFFKVLASFQQEKVIAKREEDDVDDVAVADTDDEAQH